MDGSVVGEISDAVRMALEKDPMVDPSQIRVHTRDAVVTLEGQVPTESERNAAEFDVGTSSESTRLSIILEFAAELGRREPSANTQRASAGYVLLSLTG